jgi:CheY-like chemotaxis protein
VDDDVQVLDVLSEMLRLEGYDVQTAENGRQALDAALQQVPDLVVTDLIMPEQEGIETITGLREAYATLPILAISGGGRLGPMDYLETARFIGADATLAKPFGREQFIGTVRELLDARV